MRKTRQWNSKAMQTKLENAKAYLNKRNIAATELKNNFKYTQSYKTNIAKTFAKLRSAK